MEKRFCVWVLEIAVLTAKGDRIAYWEIWEAFNTKSEAVSEQRKNGQSKLPKIGSWQRIRKYVPA